MDVNGHLAGQAPFVAALNEIQNRPILKTAALIIAVNFKIFSLPVVMTLNENYDHLIFNPAFRPL